jgi:hypothetical protein
MIAPIEKKEYLTNRDLYIEIIISKSKGKLTNKAKKMFEILAKNVIRKKKYWNNMDDKMDCFQSGLLDMLSNWHNFNNEKSDNPFAYFTEICKRGINKGFNQLYKKKGDLKDEIKVLSIESANDGQGMYNF